MDKGTDKEECRYRENGCVVAEKYERFKAG
jgi:hypothetical protein